METFNFTLTVDEANVVLLGLQELPFKTSNAVIKNLLKQVQEQTGKEIEGV